MKSKNIIWRDDDISYATDFNKFKLAHEIFKRYNVKHTIALIAKDIQKNPALISYILENNIDVQIHCWIHYRMPLHLDILEQDLISCIGAIANNFGTVPTTIYPPWNDSDEKVIKIAKSLGLEVVPEKISLGQYIRVNGDVGENTVNFHYWADDDPFLLEAALKIFTT